MYNTTIISTLKQPSYFKAADSYFVESIFVTGFVAASSFNLSNTTLESPTPIHLQCYQIFKAANPVPVEYIVVTLFDIVGKSVGLPHVTTLPSCFKAANALSVEYIFVTGFDVSANGLDILLKVFCSIIGLFVIVPVIIHHHIYKFYHY